ncbi:ribonuclease HI family protein [Granulicella mallensis]|nr:ribonuclease HI family protein [Granulicella mallensis]
MSSLFPEPSEPRVVEPRKNTASWISAHCDGGARGNPGPSGYGALIQDEAGLVLAELSEFLGIRTNNYAEYSGLLGCLQWALDNGYKNLRVVSDSELMVKQIQGKYKVNSPDLRPLWEEARRRIAQLDGFQISHALRHKNKDADRLANEAMDRGMKRPRAAGETAPTPRATPYPSKSTAPSQPPSLGGVHESPGLASPASAPQKPPAGMLRGFTRDGVVHLLGSASLPDGIFVKIVPE